MDRYTEVEDCTRQASSSSSSSSSASLCRTAAAAYDTSLTTEASHLDAGWTAAKDAGGAQTLGRGQNTLSVPVCFACGTICNSGCSWHVLSSFLALINTHTHRCFRINNTNAHFGQHIRNNIKIVLVRKTLGGRTLYNNVMYGCTRKKSILII